METITLNYLDIFQTLSGEDQDRITAMAEKNSDIVDIFQVLELLDHKRARYE